MGIGCTFDHLFIQRFQCVQGFQCAQCVHRYIQSCKRLGLVVMPVVVLMALLVSSGCYTHRDTLVSVRESFFCGDLDQAAETLSKKINEKKIQLGQSTETDVCQLDQSIIDLVSGNPQAAETRLRVVRDNFDRNEQKSYAELGLSMLKDDNSISYAGEDYEKVMVRVFLALSNLLGNGQDAKAYSLQISQKQQELIEAGKDARTGENPKAVYRQVPLSAYLCGVLREREYTTGGSQDAVYWFNQMNQWWAEYDPTGENLRRAQTGRHSQRGNGIVHVIALVGRGPYKEQVPEPVTQISLLIADQIVSATSKYSVPPTVAPVMIPQVVCPPNFIHNVSVTVDGQYNGTLRTITDVGQMAVDQYEANKPGIIGRAVARRIIKKGVIYGIKAGLELSTDSPEAQLAGVALDVAGVVWEGRETADTRCWGLLPEKIQVARLELPAGEHQLQLTAARPDRSYSRGADLGAENDTTTVTVADGEDTFVVAYIPYDHVVGNIVSSR